MRTMCLKKWFGIIVAVVLLSACGNNDGKPGDGDSIVTVTGDTISVEQAAPPPPQEMPPPPPPPLHVPGAPEQPPPPPPPHPPHP